MDMLLDTGSSVTIMTQSIYEEINTSQRPELKQSDSQLRTVNGEPLDVFGVANVNIVIDGRQYPQQVTVADIAGLQGVLGLDFVVTHKCVLYMDKGIMRIDGVPVSMRPGDRKSCAHVCASEDVWIEPGEESIVWAYSEKCAMSFPGGVGMVEPKKHGTREDLVVGRALISTTSAEFPVPVFNVGNETICVKAGLNLALTSPVEMVVDDSPSSTRCRMSDHVDLVAGVAEGSSGGAVPSIPPHIQPLIDTLPDDITAHQRAEVARLLCKYQGVFMGPDGRLGQTHIVEHTIDTGDTRPIKQPPRRAPIAMRGVVEEEIHKMLDNGVIRPSNSPWSSPVVLVRKKDGTVRFCVDYRLLNGRTRKDGYPLPNISETLDTLAGSSWYNVLDMASGFWQCSMSQDDRPKTAFATHKGLFEFNVMPFGLANAPATFQRLVSLVLQGVHWKRCLAYLDDLLVPGGSFPDTLDNLGLVLDRLQRANLRLRPDKCRLFQRSVKYLGHVVSGDGVRCDPDKVSAVRDWPTPHCVSDVRSFLGLASYYRRFIPNFASVAAPLHKLTEKGMKFTWDEECQTAFQQLKNFLTEAPVLSYPTPTDPFILDTDASGVGIGAVLSQVQDGQERVICYDSKTLSKTQRAYCTTYRELLAVVKFVKTFRHFLWGRKFTVRTDHASLRWLKNFKEPEGMLARWLSVLGTYDFVLEHRPGVKHGNADGLSRTTSGKKCKPCPRDDCPQCVTVCPNQGLLAVVTRSQTAQNLRQADRDEAQNRAPPVPGTGQWLEPGNWVKGITKDDVRAGQTADEGISQMVQWLITEKPPYSDARPWGQEVIDMWLQWDRLKVIDGVLYRVGQETHAGCDAPLQLVVPISMRPMIMRYLHDNKTGGHLGINKTVASVKQRFYWGGYKDDIARWCARCEVCSRVKDGPCRGRAPLKQEISGSPMERVSIDILGELPQTVNGNKVILVATCHFTKWTEAYALPDQTAQSVADALVSNIFCRFGAPRILHSDQGRDFESRLFQEMCCMLGIEKTLLGNPRDWPTKYGNPVEARGQTQNSAC